jgi:hypothetical protein
MLATPSLPLDAGFSCVLTVVRILGGAGRVLNVDDEAFTSYLLAAVPRLSVPGMCCLSVCTAAAPVTRITYPCVWRDSLSLLPVLCLLLPGCDKYIPQALECIDALLLKRRELAVERIGIFVKQLISVAPHVATNYCMAILSIVRTLLIRYPAHQQVSLLCAF